MKTFLILFFFLLMANSNSQTGTEEAMSCKASQYYNPFTNKCEIKQIFGYTSPNGSRPVVGPSGGCYLPPEKMNRGVGRCGLEIFESVIKISSDEAKLLDESLKTIVLGDYNCIPGSYKIQLKNQTQWEIRGVKILMPAAEQLGIAGAEFCVNDLSIGKNTYSFTATSMKYLFKPKK
jgi:hypothetical protein